MRRKRNNNNMRKTKNMNAKQKKQLATRLIAISLKIDEYVYKNNKAISVMEAVAYIDEMATSKNLCRDDARSLQVIEKITRCMQAIISENQQSFNGNAVANTSNVINTLNTCPSPVYSLPDEDKNLLSQATVDANEPIVNTLEENAPDIETINISSDDEVTSAQTVQVDVEIHRAMSNLSIRNEIPLGTEECSQSILNNFNHDGTQNFKSFENSETIKQSKIDKVLNNLNSGAVNIKAPKPVTNTCVSQRNSKAASVCPKNIRLQNNNVTSQKVEYITEHKVKNKKQRKRQKKGDIMKENKIPISKKINKDITVTRKKTTKVEQKVSFQTYLTPTHDVNKHTDQNTYSATNVNPENKLLSHGTNNQTNHQKVQAINNCIKNNVTNSNLKKSMPKIYNASIQNDLSWMENIRYVREINTDEFDPKLSYLEDAFWNNCAFPKEWNELEFDYLV